MKKTQRSFLSIALATMAMVAIAASLAYASMNVQAELWFGSGTVTVSASAGPTLVPKPPQPGPNQPGFNHGDAGEEQEILRRWPALGYALFATDDIEIRGSNVQVSGGIRANDDVSIKGYNFKASNGVITPKQEDRWNKYRHDYRGRYDDDRDKHANEYTKLLTPTLNFLEMQRRASRSYRGDITINSYTVLRGVTTVYGDLLVDGWVQGGGIVVVHGDVVVSRRGAGAPGGLLIWADGNVRMSESNTNINASIVTSRDITISGSNIRIVGSLTGRDITVSGSNINITTNNTALRYFPR